MSQAMQASLAEAWYLKDIKFDGQHHRIITQNFNGYVRRHNTMQRSNNPVSYRPCSFIAICMNSFYLVFQDY
jgi:hypothetical protein